ncbi:MAG: DsrE family protein [Candidatus Helarchaeota archaeon]|nr:DsrE family protein [Candidatus Helarchaeota archaeon]
MGKVTKVLLLLKNMIYESTSPMEIIRFSKYYRKKGLDVTVILWGSMGILLGKKNKVHRMRYEEEMEECIALGVKFMCCDMGAKIIGMDESELMDDVKMVPSFKVADLLLEYQENGQLIFSL